MTAAPASGPGPIPVGALRRRCDPATLGFLTTAEIGASETIAIQPRASEALELGIGLRHAGYNIFAVGPAGVGKQTLVQQHLLRSVAAAKPADDWCYVFNFADEGRRPRSLRLPAGRGAALRRDMEKLVEELRVAIPAAFESEDYRKRRHMLEDRAKALPQKAIAEIEKDAREHGIALLRMPVGMALAPIRNGEVLAPEAFAKLPADEQERLKAEMQRVQERLQESMSHIPEWEADFREQLRELNREIVRFAIGHMMAELTRRFGDLTTVVEHLKLVEADLIHNAERLLEMENAGPEAGVEVNPGSASRTGAFRRYQVNLIVDNGGQTTAPVVYEDHPSLANLIGRIEYRPQFGAMVTDFTLIKPGALHRANGGYLILDARRLLMQPFVWDELKRALRARVIRIESLGEAIGIATPISLEPEPIPLDVKVVLLGDRQLHYLLSSYDPDLLELFKITADFDDRMARDAAEERIYAALLAELARRESLLDFEAAAVACVIDHGARLAGDAERLTCSFETIADLARESDHLARGAGRKLVAASDVASAIAAQDRRASRVRERMREAIRRGSLLIDLAGARVGQLNGLSVVQLAGMAFGWPSRITASVRLGAGKVIDIEREVELGGPIHSKGVMILAGFLGTRFARDRPLALSASLVFEQSYGGVEGDSASMAELCALLSVIGELPLDQRFAMTGSVNQHGVSQPIGAVNEKIEGFFDVCTDAGLDGSHGVIIPRANLANLMLREDVVAAVAAGKFQIHAISHADEALALLTGKPAGEIQADGRYPPGTANAAILAGLDALTAAAERHALRGERGGAGGTEAR